MYQCGKFKYLLEITQCSKYRINWPDTTYAKNWLEPKWCRVWLSNILNHIPLLPWYGAPKFQSSNINHYRKTRHEKNTRTKRRNAKQDRKQNTKLNREQNSKLNRKGNAELENIKRFHPFQQTLFFHHCPYQNLFQNFHASTLPFLFLLFHSLLEVFFSNQYCPFLSFWSLVAYQLVLGSSLQYANLVIILQKAGCYNFYQ